MNPSNKILVIITGASKGYGRALAVTLSTRLKNDSAFFLIARNIQGLEETKSLIVNPQVQVHCLSADLGKKENTETIIEKCFEMTNGQLFDQYILLNNGGSIEVNLYANELINHENVNDHFSLNVTSQIVLTARFLRQVKDIDKSKVFIVSISSAASTNPAPCFTLYGGGKVARAMHCKILAIENPELHVLSWNPGAMDTDMLRHIVRTVASPWVRQSIQAICDNDLIVPVNVSANKLWDTLELNDYESGEYIDPFKFQDPSTITTSDSSQGST